MKKPWFVHEIIEKNKIKIVTAEDDNVDIEPVQKFTHTPACNGVGSNFSVVSDNEDDSSNDMGDEKDDDSGVEAGYEDDEESVIEPSKKMSVNKKGINKMKQLETSYNPEASVVIKGAIKEENNLEVDKIFFTRNAVDFE